LAELWKDEGKTAGLSEITSTARCFPAHWGRCARSAPSLPDWWDWTADAARRREYRWSHRPRHGRASRDAGRGEIPPIL